MGYLKNTDKMTVNRDYQIQDAKNTVLAMNMEGYTPPRPRDDLRVPGENTFAMIKLGLWTMHEQNYITDHDVTVSTKIGYILCGGAVQENTVVTEQYLLDLEREAFLSLAGRSQDPGQNTAYADHRQTAQELKPACDTLTK
jgi:3-hydroxyacyl-CoA dehydrogenase